MHLLTNTCLPEDIMNKNLGNSKDTGISGLGTDLWAKTYGNLRGIFLLCGGNRGHFENCYSLLS